MRPPLLVGGLLLGAMVFAASCSLGGLFGRLKSSPVPTISPAGGNLSGDQIVTITDTSGAAVIYYTTDGSTPTTGSTRYSGPIAVSGVGTKVTIRAFAVVPGDSASLIAISSYSIGPPVGAGLQAATPQFSPAAGGYSSDQSVTISDATSGARIYYTTDGSTPTTSSNAYSGAVAVAGNGARVTIRAIAVASGLLASAVSTAAYVINYSQVSRPTSNPTAGTYSSDQSVVLNDSTPGSTIYYTVTPGSTGTAPTTASAVYSAPISVAGTGTVDTIEAFAAASGLASSSVLTVTVAINYNQVSTPQIAPSGSFSSDQSVSIASSTAGAVIHYTVTAGAVGTAPTAASPVYTGPIPVSGDGTTDTIEAIGIGAGYSNSTAATTTVSIVYPAGPPSFALGGGTYPSDQSVTISGASGSTIYYTTDGSAPTTSSSVYTGPISVAGDGTTMTIRAAQTVSGRPLSSSVSAAYSIVYPVALPTFSIPAGFYSNNLTIALSDSTSGAVLHYTTDGTTPTSSSPVYTAPITFATSGASETVQVLATDPARPTSAIASAGYSILYTPSGLAVGSATASAENLSWGSVPGATSYTLERDTSSAFTAPTVVTTGGATTAVDGSVAAGTTYFYEVYATGAPGNSASSAPIAGTTLSSNGLPVVSTNLPSGLTAPNTLLTGGDSWVSNPGTYSPMAQVLIEGGYTFLFYSWDANNGSSVGVAAYNAAGSIVNQWLYSGARYCTSVTESSPNIIVGGCQGGATVTIPWSAIAQ